MFGDNPSPRRKGFYIVGGMVAWTAYVLAAARLAKGGGRGDVSPRRARSLPDTRGRIAETPSHIPAKGWKDIILRTYHECLDDRLPTIAAGITFYSLLALFPTVTVLVSLYGLYADPATVRDHLFALSFMLPQGTFQIVEEQISRIVAEGNQALTVKLLIGLAIALWGANAGMKAIIDGLNIAYEEEEKRSFVRLNLLSIGMTLAAIVVVLFALFIVTLAPAFIAAMRLPPEMASALGVLRWLAMFVALTLGLAAIYRFGPSRADAKWRWVTWGGAAASLMCILVSLGLSAYLSSFADYNKTYGSLGAAIALMTWIWLSTCAVLLGAELNAEMEHQTSVDTTTGIERPMGLRGARMADTLGRASEDL